MAVDLPALPQGVTGSNLVLAINDRLRRIALLIGSGQAAGPPGPAGPPGSSGLVVVPGDDTQVIYNHMGALGASPHFTFAGDIVTALNGFAGLTFNSTATGAAHAVQQKDGTFVILGSGDARFQTVAATTTFNSLADTAADPATTAAFQTSGGSFIIYGNGDGQFQNLTVTNTFNSLAEGTTAAIQQFEGRFVIQGSGDALFQTVAATSTFNSLADAATDPATTAAFQTSGGDFIVYGNGNIQGQALALTVPLAPASGGLGITTTGTAVQVLIGGSPHTWGAVDLATMATGNLPANRVAAPGSDTQVVYNSGGALAASAHFTFASDVLTVLNGFTGLTFNSRADTAPAPATTAAFQTSGGSFIIYGSGDARFQTVTATTAFNSRSDLAPAPATTAAFQTSGGNFIVFGNGNIQGQALSLTTPLATAYGGLGITTTGTAGQVLIGGVPHSWGAVDLGSMVTGNLPTSRLNSGAGASGSTFWRGDGTWAPAGGAVPGGPNQIIFNSAGVLVGSSQLYFTPGPNTLTCGGGINTGGSISAGGSPGFTNAGGSFTIDSGGNGAFQNLTAAGTLYALGNLSISGFTSSAGAASFNGYVQSNVRFVCSGNNGATLTFQDLAGNTHSVVGGIVVS
jgi:hypothetical protein